jgi:hypothetical protein
LQTSGNANAAGHLPRYKPKPTGSDQWRHTPQCVYQPLLTNGRDPDSNGSIAILERLRTRLNVPNSTAQDRDISVGPQGAKTTLRRWAVAGGRIPVVQYPSSRCVTSGFLLRSMRGAGGAFCGLGYHQAKSINNALRAPRRGSNRPCDSQVGGRSQSAQDAGPLHDLS